MEKHLLMDKPRSIKFHMRFIRLFLPLLFCFITATQLYADGAQNPLPGPYLDSEPAPSFHDMRKNPAAAYISLIDPNADCIVELAAKFDTLEEAYRFVRDDIDFVPYAPPGPLESTLSYGKGSCLGKAALLVSIYRAMGVKSKDIRIVVGMVMTPQGLTDHVWVDIDYKGGYVQQDPSGMLGKFHFTEFRDYSYCKQYVMRELYCFNDKEFSLVSQLNRMIMMGGGE
ncbi:MAG: hypothetical protein C0608_00905 [Deltaproteobacteria bacterium]|nr:MAG: hypothetical protein C0608_00905 [Deltaproteobacteria bacterium]